MGFLTILGNLFKALLSIPTNLSQAIYRWRETRQLTGSAMMGVKEEVRPAGKMKRFLRYTGKVLLWVFLIALVVGTLALLFYLNYTWDLESQLGGPWSWARRVWLPLLFVLFCVLCILGWGLWKLLGPERETSEYPDIDEAWNEALTALDRAGLNVGTLPLFLVLGRPSGNIDTLFGATRLQLHVRQVPRRGQAPLHVYATRDAVYVACPTTSLLGRQAALLAGEDVEPVKDDPTADATVLGTLFSSTDAAAAAAAETPEPDALLGGGENLLAEPEGGTENLLSSSGGGVVLAEAPALAAPARHVQKPLLKRTSEMQLLRARFRYLCRVLVRTRRPFCPVNGILALLPLAATGRDEDANDTGLICRQDLNVARAALGTDCPVFALVTDLEAVPGYREFLEQVPEPHRQRLLGQGFPLVPSLLPAEVPAMLGSGVQWLCQSLAVLIYRFFQVEKARENWRDICRANTRLYALYGVLQERQERLSRILSLAVVPETGRPLFFGGCYLAATGTGTGQQAFAAGLLRLLVENQNYVAWSQEALAEEKAYQRWATLGYAGMGLVAIALALLTYWQLRGGIGE